MPDGFIRRKQQIDAFRQALQQGLISGRTSSLGVLGDRGVGKSSLLLKFGAVCTEPTFAMLPIFVSASNDIHDYLRFIETLLDKFTNALLTWPKMQARGRRELQNWRYKRASFGGVGLERGTARLFLSSGSSLLREAFKEAWDYFVRFVQLNGAIFFVDDLQNITAIPKVDLALTIRKQFQSFGIEGMNYSMCFSATAEYFAETNGPADPAPQFCTELYLEPFTLEETIECLRSVFGTPPDTTAIIATWLQGKTFGHPCIVAFVCRHLTATEREIQRDQLETIWPAIFDQLGREKFRSDISQLSVRERDLIHRFASLGADEFRAREFASQFQSEYFARLIEKRLLIRIRWGRYKLHHPMFCEFLRQTQRTTATATAKTFAPGRGGKLAAASRWFFPLGQPQGGLHSLAPSAPLPIPLSHFPFPLQSFRTHNDNLIFVRRS